MTAGGGVVVRRAEPGQATVELALVLPVVVALLALVVQVALVGRDRVALVHATRAVARAVAVDPREAVARDALRRAGGRAAGGRVELAGSRRPGGMLTVTVTAEPSRVPLVGHVAARSITERLTVMVEGPP